MNGNGSCSAARDEAAMKLLYLALRNAEKKWLAPHRDWKRMYAQFVIYFGDRIPT